MYLTEEKILQHGRLSSYKKRLKNPAISVKMENPMCGDSIVIDIKIKDNQASDISFSGEGCLISQSAASLLVEEAKKVKDISKLKKFNEKTVFKLLGIKLTLSRVQCGMLGLNALKKALIDF